MSRIVHVAAAQLGPIARSESRADVLVRLLEMMREAHACGCDLIVYPECALTAFFPHWFMEDQNEIDEYFEREMPSPATQPLFDEAARLGIGFHIGFAELAEEDGETCHFNSSVLVGPDGETVGKFRKIHLPGHADFRPDNAYQNLEQRYFDVGNLGFKVWRAFGGIFGMCICNDRRWPETYRVMGLQGVEMVLLGYNTPYRHPEHPQLDTLANFHNQLSLQAGAYQNGTWVVGVAKAGNEEGVEQIGQSVIVAPSGEIVAMASTLEDELISYRCDLDQTKLYKEQIFNFEKYRRIEHYGLITERTAAIPPEE